ncbi:hypothetical protein LTR10_008290 [Elasticomyces elasticus]|nr:hypothetical protein LTR10_008290 [Elasticomyces elasticus]KAK4967165.1 hypothetical protein LTR42_010514 [Elasticomyces elasticus]
MDKPPSFPLPPSREPNPLRPYSAYYRAPTIGPPPSASTSPIQPHTGRPTSGSAASISSTARDLLPELDIDLKTSAGEAWQNTRSLLDTLVYRYTSVLLAQPFDVAKTVLQVSLPSQPEITTGATQRRRIDPRRRESELRSSTSRLRDSTSSISPSNSPSSSDNDDEIPDYFSTTAPRSRSPRKRRRTPPSQSASPTPTPGNRLAEYKLRLKNPSSITSALSTLYTTSGALGLWRGTNTTFLYSFLLRSTDTFIRSLLLAVMGLPDIASPDQSSGASLASSAVSFAGLDLSDSPSPLSSLLAVGLASALAGLLLAPLDLIRTRLIITPLSQPNRGLVQNLRAMPSLIAPSILWLPTALAHTIPQIFSAACPLLLRRNAGISPESSPGLWGGVGFVTCLVDLFLRLPLETVVRRAQVSSILAAQPEVALIVEAAPYSGVMGTVYSIIYSEGERRSKDLKTGMVRIRRGQGFSGLVRGWKVGFWGLVGVWGAGALGGGGEGRGRGEF